GFKQGKYQIMVATDIAARGLDIDRISHVINFDMPDTADAYIHRIGRTGRAKRTGEAFTLITPDDHAMVQKIEKVMKQKLPQQTLADFDYDVLKPQYPQTTRKPMPRKKQTSPSQPKHRARRSHQTTGSGIR
ncbi:MAG TPA: helicase-related protein, partial [Anaerolineales bacterium]|nr:helicase-related protein [Anaerolineales bacterium]